MVRGTNGFMGSIYKLKIEICEIIEKGEKFQWKRTKNGMNRKSHQVISDAVLAYFI